MFSFLKKNPPVASPRNTFLALDIGTEIVKALVCEEREGQGYILGVGKKRQKLGDMYNGTIIDLENVVENCREAIIEAEREAKVSPTQTIVGIAGELVKGATTIVTYRREDPQSKIDMDELNIIVHKMQWQAFTEIRKEMARETGFSEIDVKLINAAIVDVQIDGYKVANPLGFQGKNISLAIFNSFAPLIHFNAVLSLGKTLDKEIISVVSEPYALSRSLGFEDGSDFSAIFIDIGGGTTDLAIVIGGGIYLTKMFGLGGRVFTKRIAKQLNISFIEAEKMKIKYVRGELGGPTKKEIAQVIASDVETWMEAIKLALTDNDLAILPSKILLCGGGSKLPEIKEALEAKNWYEDLPFGRQPRVSYLRPSDVVNLHDQSKQIVDQQDITPLALGNIGLYLSGKEKLLAKILKKTIRIIEK